MAVTDELRAWFEADPSRTGEELLVRLQAAYPGRYPDGLITVQRRLEVWRGEIASALVFAPRKGRRQRPCSREHQREATGDRLGSTPG